MCMLCRIYHSQIYKLSWFQNKSYEWSWQRVLFIVFDCQCQVPYCVSVEEFIDHDSNCLVSRRSSGLCCLQLAHEQLYTSQLPKDLLLTGSVADSVGYWYDLTLPRCYHGWSIFFTVWVTRDTWRMTDQSPFPFISIIVHGVLWFTLLQVCFISRQICDYLVLFNKWAERLVEVISQTVSCKIKP